MKSIVVIFAFSILFLVPIGYQEVLAGAGCSPSENTDPPSSASPGTPTSPPQCIPETNSWVVGSDSEPVPISFDPDAGPWVKHLLYPGGLNPGTQESLVEDLIVAPDVAWDDWHEEIQPGSNWEFISATITTSAGHNIVVPGLSILTPSNQIWVVFEPALQPLTTVHIEKTLQYIGPAPPNNPGVIEIWEFPTVKEVQRVVAGEIIPLESTSLLLSGMQTNFSWIIPAVVIAAGASAFLIKRKN